MSTDHDVIVEEKQELGSFVATQIARYGQDRAVLATLRSGVGRVPEEAPPILLAYTQAPGWDIVHNRRDINAAHTALSLYAMRASGSRAETAHVSGVRFGSALRAVATKRESDSATARSIRELTTASTTAEFISHLRRAVSMMAQEDVSLDFIALARDIRSFGIGGNARRKVLLAWASAYFYTTNKEEQSA